MTTKTPLGSITIGTFTCSTAVIRLDLEAYQVCYWWRHSDHLPHDTRYIIWVKDLNTGTFYDAQQFRTISGRLPLLESMCDAYIDMFATSTSCGWRNCGDCDQCTNID